MELKTKSKAVSLIIILAFALILLIAAVSHEPNPLQFMKIRTTEDVVQYLLDLGWECDIQKIEIKETVLPEQFDEVFIDYNTLQLKQGADLTHYAGKEIIIYSVPILNYQTTDTVYALIIVYNHKVIGGDIHSAAMDGFMHTLI